MRRFNDPNVPNELAHKVQLRGIARRARHANELHGDGETLCGTHAKGAYEE